ncbi:hypothetical protein HaLaN_20682 [Haematococcus lacustris]|uniref:Uncharacterized protein n=1 Tax=Haematococcus lacustris TaxID=44745 RepID=A0A699ZPN6_HAELA|nr:hypothetical protein HaLaN_20682 [Haematococcus lacustris]
MNPPPPTSLSPSPTWTPRWSPYLLQPLLQAQLYPAPPTILSPSPTWTPRWSPYLLQPLLQAQPLTLLPPLALQLFGFLPLEVGLYPSKPCLFSVTTTTQPAQAAVIEIPGRGGASAYARAYAPACAPAYASACAPACAPAYAPACASASAPAYASACAPAYLLSTLPHALQPSSREPQLLTTSSNCRSKDMLGGLPLWAPCN